MNPIIVPDGAEPFIRAQRSDVAGEVPRAYAAAITRDFATLRPWLPQRATATLDIGCGLAGLDVLLARHYPQATINLLDGTGWAKRRVGYARTSRPWNSMELALELLRLNGVTDAVAWPVAPDLTIPCDLIVSLFSWGFHYPAPTYADLACRSLRTQGRVILDIRNGRPGLDPRFRPVACLGVVGGGKGQRWCFERS